ncbi:MAG: TerB family tellurite resistance protein [Deltaproteobacteria bacterium]|nr:TerB family tellurite resistance protein [Deltaproteobacteria bacterium]
MDYENVEINGDQAGLFARGLYALSRVDGHDEREGMLIKSFWLEVSGEADLRALKQLEAAPDIDFRQLADGLPRTEMRELFLRTALLLAYADGTYSAPEKQWIEQAAAAMQMQPQLQRLDELVRTMMLSQLSHLHNTDATKQVARKLGF